MKVGLAKVRVFGEHSLHLIQLSISGTMYLSDSRYAILFKRVECLEDIDLDIPET